MEWTRETRLKLARRISELSLEIQREEFSRKGIFPEMVENTIRRIMEALEPLGFEKANNDFDMEFGEYTRGNPLHIYRDSPTHLWFETAQCRIVKIRKDLAYKLLPLSLP